MKKFRVQCWDCEFYSIYYGYPFCARNGQLSDDETTQKCKDFREKDEKKSGVNEWIGRPK